MTDLASRIVVLLGAGASADAGLPLTSRLAEEVVRAANATSPWRPPMSTRALNLTYGAMIRHQSAHGGDPLGAVNIETLISAVRLLAAREKHEAAPFVATWIDGLADLASTGRRDQGDRIFNAIGRGITNGNAGVGREIAEAVIEIAGSLARPDLSDPMGSAEAFLLTTLVKLLGDPHDVSYLDALADLANSQPEGLDIVTLNYDLTIEQMAEAAGVTVHRGIDTWTPGRPVAFPQRSGQINLVKVHGSLDWVLSADGRYEDPAAPRRLLVAEGLENVTRPWIVVGDREKLATDGPTLSLLYAAHEMLERAHRLVVVGYSFGDLHINAMIRDWMAADDSRTLIVLDRDWGGDYTTQGGQFRGSIEHRYGPNSLEPEKLPRMGVVKGTARDKLAEALQTEPKRYPKAPAEVQSVTGDFGRRLRMTLRAPSLDKVTLTAWPPDQLDTPFASPIPNALRWAADAPGINGPMARDSLELSHWEEGQLIEVILEPHAQLPLTIRVSGARPIESIGFDVLVE